MSLNLPNWAQELKEHYESNASNQFVLYGNVGDKIMLPNSEGKLGTITDFIGNTLMSKFDVVIEYDVGSGLQIVRDMSGYFKDWPSFKETGSAVREKRPQFIIPLLNKFFLYCHNLGITRGKKPSIGLIIKEADLVIPYIQSGFSQDINSMALQVKYWSTESSFFNQPLAVVLLTENIHALHQQIQSNVRSVKIEVSFPSEEQIKEALDSLKVKCPISLSEEIDSSRLVGVKISSIESLVLRKEHRKEKITTNDLYEIRKKLVEQDSNGLIEFISSKLTLDDLYGEEKLKETLRLDMKLLESGDTDIIPMGYGLFGPVGTGKSFFVLCLAGEANIPVVKLKNFRDKYVGESESNLEKIFRLLRALGRCIVFIDEADQTLGKRNSNDESGVSGRLYSMMAEEMSNPLNRGRIVWILASSRPDLIEVDFKRPGRIDVKVPLFPTSSSEQSFDLLHKICTKKGIVIEESYKEKLIPILPLMMTPGEVNNIAVKVQRKLRTAKEEKNSFEVLEEIFQNYTPPVSLDTIKYQIDLAIKESSDMDFVPKAFLT